jgi:H+/Cl- antiporter ClcA
LTCITYGTNVPAGLFLPGLIIGCCIGQIYSEILYNLGVVSDDNYSSNRKALIIIGINAMMSGYTRMTYALSVILLETTQIINLYIPATFSIIIAKKVGDSFTRGLYARAVRGK